MPLQKSHSSIVNPWKPNKKEDNTLDKLKKEGIGNQSPLLDLRKKLNGFNINRSNCDREHTACNIWIKIDNTY